MKVTLTLLAIATVVAAISNCAIECSQSGRFINVSSVVWSSIAGCWVCAWYAEFRTKHV